MPKCTQCESDLELDDDELETVEAGELVACPECGSEFEVTGTEPLELVLLSDEEDVADEFIEEEEEEEDDEEV